MSTSENFCVKDTRVANFYGVDKEFEITLDRDVPVTMRDGKRLMTNVFRPAKPGNYPVCLCLQPYGKDGFPADAHYARIPNTGLIRVSEWASWENPDPVFWVPNGYVVVSADCRATNNSEGDRFEHFSKQMGEDFHDLVEWAATQDWSNGNVGSNGVSYLALTQWLGAAEQPPSLKAIAPWEGFNDPYREHAFHGGIPDTGFFRNLWNRRTHPETGFVRKGADYENFVEEQAKHPLRDDFWKAKHPDLSKIEAPAYIVVGYATNGLHSRGTLEGFKQISSKHKWLEMHGRKEWEYYYCRESLERQRRFFDHFLKGKDNGWEDTPQVRYEVREGFYEGRWRYAGAFPIPGTDYKHLVLGPDGTLSDADSGPGTASWDATNSGNGSDRATFTMTFAERTEIVGHIAAHLWVSTDAGQDMDLHVSIEKLDKYGNVVLFPDFQHTEDGVAASGWLRVSHRELDEARSTPSQPWHLHERQIAIKPGEVVPVSVEIWPSGTAFRAGETLRLVILGHDIIDFPARYAHKETVNQGTHHVHFGGEHPSHIVVPVVPWTEVMP